MTFYYTIFLKEQVIYTISHILFVINYFYLTEKLGHGFTFKNQDMHIRTIKITQIQCLVIYGLGLRS